MTDVCQIKTAIDTTPIADLEEMILTAKDAYLWMRQWSGSAFVAGETLPPDAMSEDECKAELYSGLCKLGNHMDWLADKLSALRDAATVYTPPAVPEGWNLVPEEPTTAMILAYNVAGVPGGASGLRWNEGPPRNLSVDGYRAMLAAAPEAPTHD